MVLKFLVFFNYQILSFFLNLFQANQRAGKKWSLEDDEEEEEEEKLKAEPTTSEPAEIINNEEMEVQETEEEVDPLDAFMKVIKSCCDFVEGVIYSEFPFRVSKVKFAKFKNLMCKNPKDLV